jgi:mRNA-degrading endonuclease RelE of RelBE toxin-antitoxin system
MVTSYEIALHKTAERELNDLEDTKANRLRDALRDVSRHEQPTQHDKVKQLEGQRGRFRVRVGDVRAICVLVKPRLYVLKAGNRKNVYEDIDRVIEKRSEGIRA